MDLSALQFDVAHKLKKLKASKTDSPNPIAEAAIQAAKASSAMQNFQSVPAVASTSEKRKKDNKKVGGVHVRFHGCCTLIVGGNALGMFAANGPGGWRHSVGGCVAERLGGRRFSYILR